MSTRNRGKGEGSIDRLSDGRWRARLSCGRENGKRVVRTFYGRTRGAAVKKMHDAIGGAEPASPTMVVIEPALTAPTMPVIDQTTLAAFATDWMIGAAPGLKRSTQRFYQGHLTLHVIPLLGDRPVADIRRKDVISLIRTCRQKGLRIATVRGIVRTSSALLAGAVEAELLDSNPALNVRKHLRQGTEITAAPDPFSADDAATLLAVTDQYFPRWYAFVLCGLRTGMRLGELLALEWSDIDWRSRTIRVRRNLVRGILSTPKNHQSRDVDMTPQLAARLRLARRRLRAEFLRYGIPLPSMVFPSADGTHLDESNARKVFGRICAKAELRHRSPHDMRHTFASLLLSDGVSLLYVAKQLGHGSAAFTLKVYAHWLPATDTRHSTRLDTGRRTA